MKLLTRSVAWIALAASVSACSLGGLLGGSSKPPATLETLTPEAPDPGAITRSSVAGQAVQIEVPVVPKELQTVRVPVLLSPTDVQYVTNLQWVDTPDRLFQNLLQETVRRTTNRVVVDPNQTGVDPGIVLHGELERFGYDAQNGQVIVTFDASLAASGATQVLTRRFTASAPADGTGATVGPALNRAANEVAREVASWIGGQPI
jgi:cholesterol transport system auxiliary component